jgi:hypothetical protein
MLEVDSTRKYTEQIKDTGREENPLAGVISGIGGYLAFG